MKRVASLFLAAAFPVAVFAQSAPVVVEQSQSATVVETKKGESITEKTTTVAVIAEKKSPITFTPYGFVLMNAFASDTPFVSRLYPGQVLPCPATGTGTTTGCNLGGSFNISARQSRIGLNIGFDDTAGWTGAKLAGRFEVDFQGGYAGTTFTANTVFNPSTTFYNALVRLRLAYMTASWGTESRFQILAGQDYGLVAPLFATSVAWQADPIFWMAGNLWTRAPQFRLAYDLTPKSGFSFGIAAAALNGADNTVVALATDPTTSPGATTDFGAANRSRLPAFEGRGYIGARKDGNKIFELGFSGHTNTRRYVSPGNGNTFDVNENAVSLDLDLNLWIINLRGEVWRGNAIDDTYAGIVATPLVIRTTGVGNATVINSINTVPTQGGWAQLVLKPFAFLQLTAGYGVEVANTADMVGLSGATRYRNSQFAWGVIFPAGKNWRFSFEGCQTITNYYGGANADGNMYAFSTQLMF
jgi:hypothetical protein